MQSARDDGGSGCLLDHHFTRLERLLRHARVAFGCLGREMDSAAAE